MRKASFRSLRTCLGRTVKVRASAIPIYDEDKWLYGRELVARSEGQESKASTFNYRCLLAVRLRSENHGQVRFWTKPPWYFGDTRLHRLWQSWRLISQKKQPTWKNSRIVTGLTTELRTAGENPYQRLIPAEIDSVPVTVKYCNVLGYVSFILEIEKDSDTFVPSIVMALVRHGSNLGASLCSC